MYRPIMARCRFVLIVLLSILLMLLGSVSAAQEAPKRPFAMAIDAWESTLQQYENQFAGKVLSDQQRAKLSEITEEATRFRADARERIDYFDQLLKALGDAPEEGQAEEPAAVQEKRAALQAEKDDYLTREKFSSLAIERIRILDSTDVADQQSERIESLWQHRHSVLNITTWPRIGEHLLAAEEGENPWLSMAAVSWFLAQAIGYWFIFFFSHRFFIGYFNRLESQHTDKAISIWYKLSTRLVNLVINVPLAIGLWMLVVWMVKAMDWPSFAMPITSLPLSTVLFSEKVVREPFAMNLVLYAVLGYVVLRAILAPRNTWWGLVTIKRPNAKLLVRYVPQLLLLALLLFYLHEVMEKAHFTEESVSLLMTLGLALYAYWLNITRKRFLSGLSHPTEEGAAATNPKTTHDHDPYQWLYNLLNRLLFLSSLLIVVSALLGYQNLAVRVAVSIAFTGLVTVIFLATRNVLNILLEELTYYLQREERPNLIAEKASDTPQDTDQHQDHAPDMVVMIAKMLMNLCLLIAFLVSISLLWGYPVEQMNSLASKVITGVEIGDKTLSLQKIGLGLAFLFIGIAIAGFLNRMIVRSESLSKTTSEGVRYSIGTIFRYIFIVLTFLFSISMMGLDLSSLGFFAGALGVGIGFGLQSIVQNFVSGLILLIQRPMEIGDWVEIGTSTGVVKKINLMNTEIETFERAILIFPNSDVMSATFTNKTRGNKQGRVEIPIGVAYGSDTQEVERILKEIAQRHPKVMKYQPIMVLFREFADSSLNFELRFFIYDVFSSLSVASDIRYQIDEAFKAANIEIPFPQHVVHMQREPSSDSAETETLAAHSPQTVSADPIQAMPDA